MSDVRATCEPQSAEYPSVGQENLVQIASLEDVLRFDLKAQLLDHHAKTTLLDQISALAKRNKPLILALIFLGSLALARAHTPTPETPVAVLPLVVCLLVFAYLLATQRDRRS